MLAALISHFAQIEDPRCDWRVEHKLIDVLVIAGEIMTMPGLPKVPAAQSIRLDEQGRTEGFF